ncbi:MAG: acetyl-CoA carboxylase biotin carboxylase subunit [Acidobacteria bacterium]|nr:acetyl-CoA carboxylase biotin carboxylase subunit [Acidobacteriota bacterium]MCI0722989.1 acetyl-CoA carboxylase biotin carboxylase subunit [Acidobacteriota bacterium]
MFKKILVANRGEIALRIICACKELGIKTVAVFSEADHNSLHVRFADEAVCIGPPKSSESYLKVPSVISAAEITNADAIHPGYGFLSENAYFAEVCEACHIKFVGPPPNVIRLMGDKARALAAMSKAGLPVLPGSNGIVPSVEAARDIAQEIGYPVIVKASAGGGGRGMRIVRSREELATAFSTAQHEAGLAFSVPDVYMERYVERPRHIEFQVAGDNYGKVIHFGERECSIQRRHQKLLEESPAVALGSAIRKEMGAKVEAALASIGYSNAGTVEFLMDEKMNFYFMEMNTRIQVEHPVTEMVTGVDLVKLQILIAGGSKLHFEDHLKPRGHAIECRINAEDPYTHVPSPGKITSFNVPGGIGVRVDTAAHTECTISSHYDSLIAKLIVHANSRPEAIRKMERALEMFVIEGVKTTIPLHQRIMHDVDFGAGRFDTKFMERYVQ